MIIVMVIILIVTIVPSREQPFDSASGSLFGFTTREMRGRGELSRTKRTEEKKTKKQITYTLTHTHTWSWRDIKTSHNSKTGENTEEKNKQTAETTTKQTNKQSYICANFHQRFIVVPCYPSLFALSGNPSTRRDSLRND